VVEAGEIVEALPALPVNRTLRDGSGSGSIASIVTVRFTCWMTSLSASLASAVVSCAAVGFAPGRTATITDSV